MTYKTAATGDGALVYAIAKDVSIPISIGNSNYGTATVAVVERRHRLYGAFAFVSSYTTGRPTSSNFTRSDTNQQLVLASIATFDFDARLSNDTNPAPSVGIDGFTQHNASYKLEIQIVLATLSTITLD